MKKLGVISMVVITMILCGCETKKEVVNETAAKSNTELVSTAAQNNKDYHIIKENYTDKEIKINYPKIDKMSDRSKQIKINEIIKNDVLQVTNNYKEDINKLNLNLDYEISFKGSDIISIKYLGTAFVKGTPYPTNIIWTTNIKFDNGKLIKLSDVVTTNDSFIKQFKDGKYKPWSADLNLETVGELQNSIGNLDNKTLIEQFKEKTAKFYFTNDSLGVSVEIPHAIGDHMDFEIGYDKLDSLLLIKPAEIEMGVESSKYSDSNIIDSIPASELVKAICLSEVLNYDSFTSEPDAITTTYTLNNLVSTGNFRWKDILKVEDGAYCFRNGPESEVADNKNNTNVSPNELYQDYFDKGNYKYPPESLFTLIDGTQTGIKVHTSDLPYGVDVKVKKFEQNDYRL